MLKFRHCPSSKCWTWEKDTVSNDFLCRLKASCNTLLSCKPDMMDFRFKMADLIGEDLSNKRGTDAECPVVTRSATGWENTIDIGKTLNIKIFICTSSYVKNYLNFILGETSLTVDSNIDSQWKYALGACDSTVERTKDGNNFLVTKTFEYGGDNSGILVGPRIFLDDASTVTIKISCKFSASHTAGSDDIEIEAGIPLEGKLENEGSWKDSLTVSFIN